MDKKLLWLKIGVWQVDNGKAAWLDMYLSKSTKITTNIETTMLSGNSSTSICQSLTVKANQNSHKYWDGNAVHIFSVEKTDCIRIGGRRSIYFWLSCQTSEFWPACLQAIKIWQLLSIKENICAERPSKSYALQDAKNIFVFLCQICKLVFLGATYGHFFLVPHQTLFVVSHLKIFFFWCHIYGKKYFCARSGTVWGSLLTFDWISSPLWLESDCQRWWWISGNHFPSISH